MHTNHRVMEVLGYVTALFIGISLGLTGSGGSILMLPVLVYLFGVEILQATTYSLFVVGITSITGLGKYIKEKSIDTLSVITFGIPSLLLISITRRYITPEIPENIHLLNSITISRHILLMTLFSLLMILASLKFIRKKESTTTEENTRSQYYFLKLGTSGVVVGFLTGLLGIGGGFLIVPALVTFVHLDMKKAVGTSLLLITANSLIGFLSEKHFHNMDWTLLVTITTISIVGMIIGSKLVQKINTAQLKTIFGWFILSMGIMIMLKEIIVYSYQITT